MLPTAGGTLARSGPAPSSPEDLAAATKCSARTINKALDKGHIVLLGFSKPEEGQEQYLYDIEHTCRDPGAKSLADEYIAFRKQYSVKDEAQVDEWVRRSHTARKPTLDPKHYPFLRLSSSSATSRAS